MSDVEKAIRIAMDGHAGQTDKAGKPYILHPLRVMMACSGDENKMVAAVLHDVVEDTGLTLQDLIDVGINERVVIAIDALTRREGEKYETFIERCAYNSIARSIKLQDIDDNLDFSRLNSISDADVERLQKYHRARRFLIDMKWPDT